MAQRGRKGRGRNAPLRKDQRAHVHSNVQPPLLPIRMRPLVGGAVGAQRPTDHG